MVESAHKRAVETYRSRLAARGIARFEIQALAGDRDLIRALARKMSAQNDEATQLRATVLSAVQEPKPKTGGILAALRASPLVGADLDFTREWSEGRDVDL